MLHTVIARTYFDSTPIDEHRKTFTTYAKANEYARYLAREANRELHERSDHHGHVKYEAEVSGRYRSVSNYALREEYVVQIVGVMSALDAWFNQHANAVVSGAFAAVGFFLTWVMMSLLGVSEYPHAVQITLQVIAMLIVAASSVCLAIFFASLPGFVGDDAFRKD